MGLSELFTSGVLSSTDPRTPGWYATLACWDELEGLFPGAHYWDGERWLLDTNASIDHWPIVFTSESQAEAYARDNDPERY